LRPPDEPLHPVIARNQPIVILLLLRLKADLAFHPDNLTSSYQTKLYQSMNSVCYKQKWRVISHPFRLTIINTLFTSSQRIAVHNWFYGKFIHTEKSVQVMTVRLRWIFCHPARLSTHTLFTHLPLHAAFVFIFLVYIYQRKTKGVVIHRWRWRWHRSQLTLETIVRN